MLVSLTPGLFRISLDDKEKNKKERANPVQLPKVKLSLFDQEKLQKYLRWSIGYQDGKHDFKKIFVYRFLSPVEYMHITNVNRCN